METLEELSRRIRTAEELLSVVKTMKALAAANIREYEQAAESLRQYAATVELGFRILMNREPQALRNAFVKPDEPATLIAIGSDQGMVGRFNEDVVAQVLPEMRRRSERLPAIIAVGTRLSDRLSAESFEPRTIVELPGSSAGVVRRVQDVLVALESSTVAGHTGTVLLAHHRLAHRRPGGERSWGPVLQVLLPLDPDWLAQLRAQPWPRPGIPMYTLPTRELLGVLVRQHLLVRLQRALAESLMAENVKRLATMQVAEQNVAERIEAFRAGYRRRRQAAITSELLEIVAGFEVLK